MSLLRSYKVVYLKDNVLDGLNTFDFHLPSNIFHNASENPESDGFCDPSGCLGNGVLNISTCYGGISGFISQPHFLNADDKFVEAVQGLSPNNSKHDFVISFEPESIYAIYSQST